MCLISFINDYSLFKICQSYNLQYDTRLLALGSSYVVLVFGTRTFSNTFEMALCSILLYYVAEAMVQSNTIIYHTEYLKERYDEAKTTVERVKIYKLKSSLPSHTFNNCAIISTLCVVGVFNRPTFLVFGLPIVFYWLHRGMGTKIVTFFDFNLRIVFLVITAIPSLIFFIIFDSMYYGYLSLAEIFHNQFVIGLNNFVVTPLNFIKYNLDPTKTAEHGVHPKYVHFLVNIPLLFNILGVIAICSLLSMVYRFLIGEYRTLPRAQSVIGLMTCSIFVPVFFLSFINHQEPRFLIPILLPIILLHSPKLKSGISTNFRFLNRTLGRLLSSKYLLNSWFIINIICTLVYGFLHQGGIYNLTEYLSNKIVVNSNTNINIHLVTSHIYNIPQSFLLIPNTNTLHVNPENNQKYRKSKKFHLYEYGGTELPILFKKLKLILDVCEMKRVTKNQKYLLYLTLPSSLAEELNLSFYNSNITFIKHNLVKVFYPHLSVEALPKLFVQHPCEVNTDIDEIDQTCSIYSEMDERNDYSMTFFLRQFSSVIHQFGLNLYKIEFVKKK